MRLIPDTRLPRTIGLDPLLTLTLLPEAAADTTSVAMLPAAAVKSAFAAEALCKLIVRVWPGAVIAPVLEVTIALFAELAVRVTPAPAVNPSFKEMVLPVKLSEPTVVDPPNELPIELVVLTVKFCPANDVNVTAVLPFVSAIEVPVPELVPAKF